MHRVAPVMFALYLKDMLQKNEIKYKIFTVCFTVALIVYAIYIFTHANALVFQSSSEYHYSQIVRVLAKYGSFVFMGGWLIQLIWFLRGEIKNRFIKLLSWINIFFIPLIVGINVIPYTGILG